jgi:hypothetical protein
MLRIRANCDADNDVYERPLPRQPKCYGAGHLKTFHVACGTRFNRCEMGLVLSGNVSCSNPEWREKCV